MFKALEIAHFFIWRSGQDADAGEAITNLKLQKLLYYAQGFHLALHKKPLFSDKIEAWAHGPVVPTIYRKFKAYGSQAIPFDKKRPDLPKAKMDFLQEMYNFFGQFSAWRLREMTHQEPPWRDADSSDSKLITHESLTRYFKTQLTS